MALFDTTFAPYVPFGSRNLSLRTPELTGTDVAVLQAVYGLMLKTMTGSGTPIGAPVAIDGKFGVTTKAAVLAVQKYFGLATDGVVGPNTYFLFGQGVGPNTTYGGPVYGSRQLEQGMSGGDVIILQNRLSLFRYASAIGHPPTGNFDAATAKAVLQFKADAVKNGNTGFPENAVVGYGTYNATWLYTFAGGRAIFTGRNGFDVVFLQVLLTGLGFYHGSATGIFDAGSKAALTAFQISVGITADGTAGPTTYYQLGLKNPVGAPSPLGVSWPGGAPPPATSQRSVLLSPPSGTPFGVASFVTSPGGFTLNVAGNGLPPPSAYGAQYGQYAFAMADGVSGLTALTGLMVEVRAPADWAGAASASPTPAVHPGPTTVMPTPAGSVTGPFGPVVLSGNLADAA